MVSCANGAGCKDGDLDLGACAEQEAALFKCGPGDHPAGAHRTRQRCPRASELAEWRRGRVASALDWLVALPSARSATASRRYAFETRRSVATSTTRTRRRTIEGAAVGADRRELALAQRREASRLEDSALLGRHRSD